MIADATCVIRVVLRLHHLTVCVELTMLSATVLLYVL
jgi:hypothetical protein